MENICHALCTYMILCLTLGYVTFGMPFEGYQITDPDTLESDNNEILHILDGEFLHMNNRVGYSVSPVVVVLPHDTVSQYTVCVILKQQNCYTITVKSI